MIKRSSIQTNQTRTYINLYDKDVKLEYNLSESNLEFAIGVIVPGLTDPNELSSYISVFGQWFDETVETDNNSSESIDQAYTSFYLDEWANDFFDVFQGVNSVSYSSVSGKFFWANNNFVLKSQNRTNQK